VYGGEKSWRGKREQKELTGRQEKSFEKQVSSLFLSRFSFHKLGEAEKKDLPSPATKKNTAAGCSAALPHKGYKGG
jgi:hypothetical protein